MLKITNCVLKLVYFIDAKGNCDLCSKPFTYSKTTICRHNYIKSNSSFGPIHRSLKAKT